MEKMREMALESHRKQLAKLQEKYYSNDEGNTWCCKKCHSEIQCITQTQSLHMAESLEGFGETRQVQVPYCPKCEKKPSTSGFADYGDDPFADTF